MGANVSSLAESIVSVLRDADHEGWDIESVYDAILESEMVICNFRPDATAINGNFICAGGCIQSLEQLEGVTATAFISPQYNVSDGQPTTPIRMSALGSIDKIRPRWRMEPQASEVKEIMFDERIPTVFSNYPPVIEGTVINIAYAIEPAQYGTVDESTETTVKATFTPILKECALYRLFSHDLEGTVNFSRSQRHWQNFQSMMGIKVNAEKLFGPKNLEYKK